LDLQRYELRYAGKLVKLEPQVFNVLVYLIQQRDRVVTKEELLEQLWPGRFVSEATLTSRVMAARRAVGDRGREQRLIQTVHGRGYRFIAAVEERLAASPGPEPQGHTSAHLQLTPEPHPLMTQDSALSTASVVGRETELAQLHRCLQQALMGRRQVVFVTGEAGLGKTALVEGFLAELATSGMLWIARGQCLEHYGPGEAYLPVLEAWGRLFKEPEGQMLVEVMARQAPAWILQMPWLIHGSEFEALQRRVLGATRERMLREMAEAIEVLTAQKPLILVLEDLHWSDPSTLNLIASLARRQEPARLMLLGTYRPADAMQQNHPLQAIKHELQLHKQCEELPLTLLTEATVAAYLARRLPGATPPAVLARLVHQRTGGNPLFMVNVVEYWLAQGLLLERDGQWTLKDGHQEPGLGIPDNLRQLIDMQFDQLTSEERQVLEAGSVAGIEFSAAAAAAGLAAEVLHIEESCEGLARRGQLLQARGEQTWPDGTVAGSYGFVHTLYQEVIYSRLPAARRIQLHRRIGEREEVGYGMRARERAAELAVHFEQGRDYQRAVSYRQYAAENALRWNAQLEAIMHVTKGLELLQTWSDTPERTQQELNLQIMLGPALIAAKGSAAPEVEQTYARARALCQQVGQAPELLPALRGLCRFYRNQGALQTARELGEQLDRLAQREAAPTPRLEAHETLGNTLFMLGEYAAAQTHLQQGITLTDPGAQRVLALRYGVAPGVTCLAYAVHTLWCLGYPEQALQRSQEAIALAQALAHPHSLALAQYFVTSLYHRRRELPAVQAQADALLTLATAQGFPLWAGFATCWRGWALVMQGRSEEGLAQLRQGMAAVLATGQTLSRPFCLVLLAEAAGHAGQIAEGLRLLAEALTAFAASGRGDLLTEAYRLQGEFLLRQAIPDVTQAEACFHQALNIARRQQARSWELRATMSLSRLWQGQGRRAEAHQRLAEIYSWFTEGFDTADLREAKVLLEQLAGRGEGEGGNNRAVGLPLPPPSPGG
jgi:DNA-binding winged helix-turn-helix (wHTH) protein/predicted ATPase